MDTSAKGLQTGKYAANRWFTFAILVLGAGTIFKLSSLKDAFYVPMQQYMGLRFSKKYMISFSLVGVGLTGIYLSTFPSYAGFLAAFAVLAIFGEVVYWPVLLKAVRLTATEEEQGRIFGFLEAGRGVVDTIVAFSALAIFTAMGSSAAGLKGGILFFSGVVIVVGIISFFLVPHDEIRETNDSGEKIGRNAAAQYGLKMVGGPVGGFLADKVTKSTSKYIRAAFVVAAVAMTVIVMLPHEKMNIYVGMTLTLGFGAIIFTMRAVFFAPMDEIKVPIEISGAAMSIGSLIGYFPSTFAYTLYGSMLDKAPGLAGAPMDEIKVPIEISGAAMSIGSLIGYFPSTFAYTLYGSMLDKAPGLAGYKMVFITMIGFSVVGFFISSYLVNVIKKKQQSA